MKFSQRLKELGFTSYDAYLKSDHWKAFKRGYRDSGNQTCCLVCGNSRVHFHHRTYERLGWELPDDIRPLCESHHDQVHAWLLSEKATVEQTDKAIELLKTGLTVDLAALLKRRVRPEKANKPKKIKSVTALSKQLQGLLRTLRGMKRNRPSLPIWKDSKEWLSAATPHNILAEKATEAVRQVRAAKRQPLLQASKPGKRMTEKLSKRLAATLRSYRQHFPELTAWHELPKRLDAKTPYEELVAAVELTRQQVAIAKKVRRTAK